MWGAEAWVRGEGCSGDGGGAAVGGEDYEGGERSFESEG